MSGLSVLRVAVMMIFVLNGLVLGGILIIKPWHRARQERHSKRRGVYTNVLSRHIATETAKLEMGKRVAEDQAFLDALIDMRSVVFGPEAEMLGNLVNSFDIARRQSLKLRRWLGTNRRLRAAVALAELADASAAPTLMDHLADPEREIRIQCARGLGRMRWRPAIDAILQRLEVENSWVQSRFTDTLAEYGVAATWPLISYVRINNRLGTGAVPPAVRTLGAVGDSEAVLPLMEILGETKDPETRIAIVEALGELGGPLARPPVENAARSDDWRLRAKAATALASIGDPGVIPTLTKGLADANWWVRRNSAAALTQLPGGTDALYAALASPDPFARDAACEALADAGEVIGARNRIETGSAIVRDFHLIGHVEGRLVGSST